jgi:integrase/recombinase XerD
MLRTTEFIKERRYLQNVSPRTVQWYTESFKWLERYCPTEVTQEGLNGLVIGMREAGLKPVSCNARIRAVKAYLAWAQLPLKLAFLKEAESVIQIYSPDDIKRLVSFRPRLATERRLYSLTMLLFDTGCRLEEALNVRKEEVDLENLLLSVRGKGNKLNRSGFTGGSNL